MNSKYNQVLRASVACGCVFAASIVAARLAAPSAAQSATGPFTDYRTEAPGTVHRITVADLPKPYATDSAQKESSIVARPANDWPQVPAGFKAELYATGLDNPRLLRTAPNGDVFVAES